MSRIGIIGVGHVGAAVAYALILRHVARELLLVDTKVDRRDGQVRDLSDVASVVAGEQKHSTRVRAATHHEAARECDIIVLTAGSKYTLGETSMQHLYCKIAITRSILAAMKPIRPDAILLVVSNPVDLLTSLARELSGLPPAQVLGTGTCLDSDRLRAMAAQRTGASQNAVDLFVIGVHGHSQVPAWSTATIAGKPIQDTLVAQHPKVLLADECKRRSEGIFRAKGSTECGVAAVICRLCESILRDERIVKPVSHFQPDYLCCFSLPAVLGREGVLRTVTLPLDEAETEEVDKSAKGLRQAMEQIKEDSVV
ncbi:L-lactate/malate dehydrogenase [Aspergillus ellipticus CBS 707.79]|uniref:L-lactate/malate dehydrogenase n=1 Tax=Aspergillus ellipticus CBS 707.79 TaxID=1448320 RepID=A0A319DET5_9EURO|nr:L-lactate/malate dehydrogenase [Aspergillus ellipticus CBS 707.79]